MSKNIQESIISNNKEKKNPVESFIQRASLPNTRPIVKNYPKKIAC